MFGVKIRCTSAHDCGACDGPALWQNACDREDRQPPHAGHAWLPHDSPYSAAASMCGHILHTETQHQFYNRALLLNGPAPRTAPGCLKLRRKSTIFNNTPNVFTSCDVC